MRPHKSKDRRCGYLMNSRYLVAAALALSALLSWSVAMAKIEHFKDEKGTLHISNSGEAESKGKAGPTPTPAAPVVEPPTSFPEAGEVVEEPPPDPEPPPEAPPPEMEVPPVEEAAPPPNE